MNKEPETYEELIRYKRCVDLTLHYDLSREDLDQIYNFLATYQKAVVIGNKSSLTLKVSYNTNVQPIVIHAKCIDSTIDGIRMSNELFTLIPHYVPYTSSGGGSSYGNIKNGRISGMEKRNRRKN